jgi:tetratricopeptide (TPR) repeat protein
MKVISFLLFLAFLASLGFADEQHAHHSDKYGVVKFSISCLAESQVRFNRAVAILHSFGYEEASIAFNEIAESEPDCAMAYWGVAMTYYHPIWAPPNPQALQKGKEAIEKAKLATTATDREKAYIAALSVFYDDSDKWDHKTRAKNYSDAMKQVAEKFPDDHEASIFYALALRGTAPPDDKTYVIQKQSAEILNEILAFEPEHPGIAHYLIHCFDYPEMAEQVLPAARIYSKIAPSSPHALHMPSHIFTRLGLWQESVNSNIASAKSAVEHVQKLYPGSGSFDQLHAMDYLVYAYLQEGQDRNAKQVLDEAKAITKLNHPEFQAVYAFAAMPTRYAVERGNWADAAELSVAPLWLPWQKFPYAEAIVFFGRGLGAARSGSIEAAQKDLVRLDELHQAALELKDPSYDWPRQVEIQQKSVAAWIELAKKNNEEALILMRAAADLEDSTDKHPVTPGSIIPARELLGDMLLKMNQPAEALLQYEKSLISAPNRFHSLTGAAKAAQLSGDKEKAKEYYGKLLQLCGSGCERLEITEAKSFLAKS